MKNFSPTQNAFLGILLLSLFSGLLTQEVHTRRGTALPWRFVPGGTLRREAELEGFPVVDTTAALALLAAGAHLFLDARSLSEYSQDHIPGAMPLPVAEFEQHFPDLAPILLPDSPLLVYCSGPACDEALRLARRLREAGQENVTIYLDGLNAWRQEIPQ